MFRPQEVAGIEQDIVWQGATGGGRKFLLLAAANRRDPAASFVEQIEKLGETGMAEGNFLENDEENPGGGS